MTTRLTEFVHHHTTSSLDDTLARAIEAIAEEMARELLRDAEFKAEMRELVRAAFRQTLQELNEGTP